MSHKEPDARVPCAEKRPKVCKLCMNERIRINSVEYVRNGMQAQTQSNPLPIQCITNGMHYQWNARVPRAKNGQNGAILGVNTFPPSCNSRAVYTCLFTV